MHKDDQHSDDESSTETPTDPEAQHILKEIGTKRPMNQAMINSIVSAMEVKLNRLVKVVNDVTDAAAKEMKKSTQEGFTEVRTKLESFYDIVSKISLENATLQEIASMSTEPRDRNV